MAEEQQQQRKESGARAPQGPQFRGARRMSGAPPLVLIVDKEEYDQIYAALKKAKVTDNLIRIELLVDGSKYLQYDGGMNNSPLPFSDLLSAQSFGKLTEQIVDGLVGAASHSYVMGMTDNMRYAAQLSLDAPYLRQIYISIEEQDIQHAAKDMAERRPTVVSVGEKTVDKISNALYTAGIKSFVVNQKPFDLDAKLAQEKTADEQAEKKAKKEKGKK